MKSILFLFILMSVISCRGLKPEEIVNENPSIQEEYSRPFERVISMMRQSLHQNQIWLSEREYLLYRDEILSLRGIVPESGFTLPLVMDDLSGEAKLTTNPGISKVYVDRLSLWHVCQAAFFLNGIVVETDDRVDQVDPHPATAYVGTRAGFAYGNRSPQYTWSPDLMMDRVALLKVRDQFRHQGCRSSRTYLEYKVLPDATFREVAKWREQMDGVLADLSRLRESQGADHPSVTLGQIIESMERAFEGLP